MTESVDDQHPPRDDVCPECGSTAITEKGINIDGQLTAISSTWTHCLNCGWEDR